MEVKLGEKNTENYSEAFWGSKDSPTITVNLKPKISSQGQEHQGKKKKKNSAVRGAGPESSKQKTP